MSSANPIESVSDAQRLQLLIDGVAEYAIYLIGLDGRVLSWNSGAKRLIGYEAGEIIGRPFADFFTPEDRAEGLHKMALATATATGHVEMEGWRVRKDGTRFWALGAIDAIRGDQGEVMGFADVTRDMTERRLNEHGLEQSEQRFRRLVNAVVDYAIFQLDPSGHITTWNEGAHRIKGYTADEIIGTHFSRFYTSEDRAAGVPQRGLSTAEIQGRFEAEGWRVRKDGTQFWASVVIDAIRSDEGELVGFAKVTRDITERMQAQRALAEAREQLAAAQKMEAIGQLSGGIAHDFNNLLMVILGNLETAQKEVKQSGGGPNLQRVLSNAMRGAQRAAALTGRLLAFSRRQPLNPKLLDLNSFLSSAAEFIGRSLGELIEIEVVGAAGLWQVEVDSNHLETALLNLAINARDAMPTGGKLTLEAANTFVDENYCRLNPELSPGQFVVIAVSDTGAGMPREVLSRAFEPFFTTKEAGQGTGLGLSQVYGFVKQSGGHVKIYSEVGQGTSVKIYLPRLLAHARDEDDAIVPSSEGAAGEVILIVEDDRDVRTYLIDVLRALNYSVLSASDADQALKLLAGPGTRIDLLLTDIIMPGKNGRQLADEALRVRPALPVLFMTGYSRNAVVHQGRLDAGVELLQKPITQSELASRVRGMLDRRKSGA